MIYNGNMLSKENAKQLGEILKILSEKQKLAILIFLKAKGGRSVGQIADHLEISFKATSKHLLRLTKERILARRYDGNFVLYEIAVSLPEPARLIISHLL